MKTKPHTSENELENKYLLVEINSLDYLKAQRDEAQCDNSNYILDKKINILQFLTKL